MTDKDARSLSKKDLMRIINRLEEENERLRTKLAISKKDSSTSGKPPSSDIVKPPGTPKGKKKPIFRGCAGQIYDSRLNSQELTSDNYFSPQRQLFLPTQAMGRSVLFRGSRCTPGPT